jgi:endoglucanase
MDGGGRSQLQRLAVDRWRVVDLHDHVAPPGSYTVRARVAAAGAGGGAFHVEFGGGTSCDSVFVPDTGGWQAWTDVYLTVTLSGGTQTMRFVEDSNGPVSSAI